jgi:hypothetical protein
MFYFCSIDCEEEVRGEPEHWLAIAKMPAAEQKKYAHGHEHHAQAEQSHDHAAHGHDAPAHGHEGHTH